VDNKVDTTALVATYDLKKIYLCKNIYLMPLNNFFEKYFADSKTCCTFAPSAPAKPLYNAQIGGAFYFTPL
jgi:hypothetical protein